MSKSKNQIELTPRELDVLNILWSSEKPLIASEIAETGDGLSINTVQAVLRSLLKKEFIKIADIVYSGTVLTRSYKPTISKQGLKMENLKNQFNNIDKDINSIPSIIAYLIEDEDNEDKIIDELQELINKKRREYYKGDK